MPFFFKTLTLKKNATLWPLFRDRVQMSQGYRDSTRSQDTFYHSVPRSSWYSFNRPWKDERLNWPCSYPKFWTQDPWIGNPAKFIHFGKFRLNVPFCDDLIPLYFPENTLAGKNNFSSFFKVLQKPNHKNERFKKKN